MNRRIVDHPWITIALFALATAVLALRIPELTIDPDVRAMMASKDPEFALQRVARGVLRNRGPRFS